MKRALLFLTLFSFLSVSEAQNKKYWIRFKDKNNSPYSVGSPLAYLSQKAIDRRSKQNIPIRINDLPVNPSYIDSVRSKGVPVLNRSKWFNAVTVEADSTQLNQILSLPFVLNASHVKRLSTEKAVLPGKDLFVSHTSVPRADLNQSGNKRIMGYDYGMSYNQIGMLKGDLLHSQGFDGRGMTIAVLDAGFYNVNTFPSFDSLRANGQILGTWDFVANEPGVYEDNSHGTSVLSLMGGNIPGQLIGTAPKASYWLLRSEDVGEYLIEECNWASAAEFADSVGADIINSSLGYTTFDDPAMNHTYADLDGNTTIVTRAADIAASKGILVVNSAGNYGGWPWRYIGAPADGDSVLAVGAVQWDRSLAGFSSRGPSADGRVKPNVMAQGAVCVIQDDNGSLTYGNGTSYSGPILAGMAACLWQAHPTSSNMHILEAIEKSGDRYTSPSDSMGYGIPDFEKAHQIVSINQQANKVAKLISIYPNPVSGRRITINLISDTAQKLDLRIFDALGKLAYTQSERIGTGYNVIPFELHSLSKGVYHVKLNTEKDDFFSKLVIY
jgi:serine protease AprX